MALLKIGTRVHAKNRVTDFKGTIYGKVKWENPFSVFKKKGWNYLLENEKGETISVDTDICTKIN